MKKILVGSFIAAMILSGCGYKSNVMISQNEYDSIDESEVIILMNDKPECAYEVIAAVTIDQYDGQANAIEKAKEEAADLGADYVSINFINTYSDDDISVVINTYSDDDISVAGIAYRCNNQEAQQEEEQAPQSK